MKNNAWCKLRIIIKAKRDSSYSYCCGITMEIVFVASSNGVFLHDEFLFTHYVWNYEMFPPSRLSVEAECILMMTMMMSATCMHVFTL